jgi:translocation and assembly module TamA
LPDFDAASNGRIPITVSLSPLERIEYTIGAGFATDTGPRFRAGYRNRRLNPNGHSLTASLRASPVLSGVVGEFRKPLKDPRSEWLSYTGAFDREVTDSFVSDISRLGVRRSKRLSTSWLRTLSLDFSYEDFTVADVSNDSRLVLPAIAFDHKSGDRELYPFSGRRIGAQLRGSHTAIGSSTSFLQVIGRIRWIMSFGEQSRLISRASVGWTQSADFEKLPPSVRFFAGGDESVRGYGYESLGPTDADGQVIGGDGLLVGSLEFERRVRGNFYGAAFVDAGNAFEGNDIDPAVGVGLGIKWRSPIGGIRLYLAHPLNKSSQNIRVHISLGPEL